MLITITPYGAKQYLLRCDFAALGDICHTFSPANSCRHDLTTVTLKSGWTSLAGFHFCPRHSAPKFLQTRLQIAAHTTN